LSLVLWIFIWSKRWFVYEQIRLLLEMLYAICWRQRRALDERRPKSRVFRKLL